MTNNLQIAYNRFWQISSESLLLHSGKKTFCVQLTVVSSDCKKKIWQITFLHWYNKSFYGKKVREKKLNLEHKTWLRKHNNRFCIVFFFNFTFYLQKNTIAEHLKSKTSECISSMHQKNILHWYKRNFSGIRCLQKVLP